VTPASKRPPLWLGSLALNAALASALAWQLLDAAGPGSGVARAGVGSANVGGERVGRSLDWRSIAARDLPEYARNLRALGCPEATVFHIIAGELDARNAARASRLAEALPQRGYWESAAALAPSEATRRRELWRALRDAKQAVLREIFGADAVARLARDPLSEDGASDAAALGFLGEETRRELLALHAAFDRREEASSERDFNGSPTEAAAQRLAELQAERRREIERLLTPDELFELDLRTSATADRLRSELAGFRASEGEFRELFRIRQSYERGLEENVDVRDPEVVEARLRALQQLADASRVALGPDRYAAYERSRDVDFQSLLRMTRYFGAPEGTAEAVHALQQSVVARADRISADTSLSEQQQGEALADIQGQTEQALADLLGARVLGEYRRSQRWWIWSD